ncbi:MAG: hypothetical protein Q8N08_04955 [Methanobacteriaceae archaeon]|nr:hypothetical protein [Methanobacteriaceae archaeon]
MTSRGCQVTGVLVEVLRSEAIHFFGNVQVVLVPVDGEFQPLLQVKTRFISQNSFQGTVGFDITI